MLFAKCRSASVIDIAFHREGREQQSDRNARAFVRIVSSGIDDADVLTPDLASRTLRRAVR